MKKNYEIDMCNGPITGKMLRFALPLMLSSMLQLLFNAADIITVGKFGSEHSLAAVGSNTALINLLTNLFIGLSIGANVLVARFYGAKNGEELNETVHTAMLLSLISGLILTVTGVIFARYFLIWMKTPAEILDLATTYLKIYFLGMPAMMIYNFGSAILRAIGDTKRPLYFLAAAGVINIILNILLVVVFRLDVKGVGIATVISQTVSAILIIRCLAKSNGDIKLELKKLRLSRGKIGAILRIGLIVRDTWSQFSLFGQVVILMLIQVGGLGLVTLTSFFALAARRRMGFRDLRLLGESVSADGLSKATEVLKIVIKLAAAFEAVGIVLLLFAFVPQFGAEGVWVSVFTAISAFCNAGFDLFGRFGAYSSLVPYVNNYYVQAVVMFMIMAGGLGFMVWVELAEYRKKRRLSLHAKVVLQFSAIFWVGGAVLLALLEWSNPKTMGGLSVPSKLMAALFQSVSTRTAGMNTIDLAACSPISKLLMSVLQFIGAAPGSTGGGVKVTTFAVLILTIRSVAQGRDDCVIGGHHIESKTVYRALTIIVLGAVAAFGSAVVVYYNTAEAVSVIDCIFESCSAFGTVGLSVGVTGQLNTGAKLLYMACMFMGRVGPASLAISLTAKPDDNKRKVLPVGHINVG